MIKNIRPFKRITLLLAVLFLGSCAILSGMKLNDLYGPSAPRERQVATIDDGKIDYWHDVQPVIEQRCVVCHGCYDAPCQLKMNSIEGIDRGATKALVYDAQRILEADPTRLFQDVQTTAEWRQKGFFSVLNEHSQDLIANRDAGVMYQLLDLKQKHPLPTTKVLSDDFEFDIDRTMVCPTPAEFQGYAADNPLWGMPYALPALNQSEHQTLTRWLDEGATHTPRKPLSKELQAQVSQWEAFLNQDSLKGQLASRYIYEHLFLGNLYFNGVDNNTYFRLVRSVTPPGQPIAYIATRRPYDDPGVERAYYRLREHKSAIVAKTHMPYALDKARMARWNALFFNPDFEVTSLPGYDPEKTANPFIIFDQLPVSARYDFMLDEAQFTVMGFIKGPVCKGQIALNVINDHFWVFFAKPNDTLDEAAADFIRDNQKLLELPSEAGSTLNPLSNWLKYSSKQREFHKKRDRFLSQYADDPALDISERIIWDGDGHNANAALTVYRHFNSASVDKGLIGEPPKTAWVLSYADLERIHYLLVAGFDVYGNISHQLLSRLYMDFLRMEGESKFLLLLPEETRNQEIANWYRQADGDFAELLHFPELNSAHKVSQIDYKTDDPKQELYGILKQRLDKVLPKQRQLATLSDQNLAKGLDKIHQLRGLSISQLPEISMLLVETDAGDEHFTIVRNQAHLNITSLLDEQDNRIPEEDRADILRGFVGSYPNAFFKAKAADVPEFVDMLGNISTPENYALLLDKFGVRRTDPSFWAHSDRVHQVFKETEPQNYGLLDYNRLDNR